MVIRVKKGEELEPNEELRLHMIKDRWTVSFMFRRSLVRSSAFIHSPIHSFVHSFIHSCTSAAGKSIPWEHCERLEVVTGEGRTVQRERDLAAIG